MMALAGVAVRFERYLCLWKTVADTQVARGVNHPNLPCAVVFERGVKEIYLSTVFGKSFSAVWFVAHYRFYANRYEWFGVVVMLNIYVGVGGYFRFEI